MENKNELAKCFLFEMKQKNKVIYGLVKIKKSELKNKLFSLDINFKFNENEINQLAY